MKSRSKVPKVKCLVFYDLDSLSIDKAGRGHIKTAFKDTSSQYANFSLLMYSRYTV